MLPAAGEDVERRFVIDGFDTGQPQNGVEKVVVRMRLSGGFIQAVAVEAEGRAELSGSQTSIGISF